MTSRLRRLLPSQPSGEDSTPPIASEEGKKRRSVPVACLACQRAKSKCSGDRPVCHRCGKKNIPCEYDVEPNQTRASSRREVEEQLRELYTQLQTRPWSEALDILRRIRVTPDPLHVVHLVKAGDILLYRAIAENSGDMTTEPRHPSAPYPSHVQSPPPSRWTTITEQHTVQTLLSVFFDRDQRFLMPFIDKDMFLGDMQANLPRPHAELFCSTLLVNAICAITACHCTLTAAINFTSTRDLGEAFFTEAKGLLDMEAGKPSLTTAQALFVMYSYSCRTGQDRAGNVFRSAGYEMMERMMPKFRQALSNTTHPADSRRAISRAVWGVFCFDSICSSVYLRPSLVSMPDVPLPFDLLGGVKQFQSERQTRESTWELLDHQQEDMTLRYTCDVSRIFNKALDHAVRRYHLDGTRHGDSQLPQLYRELQTLQSKLPDEDEYEGKYYHEHCHLWAYHHIVAANIARLLQNSGTKTPSLLDRPIDTCVRHCQRGIEHINRHLTRHPSERQGSLPAVYFAYTCIVTLLDLVGVSASVEGTFSQACQIFHEATEYPLSYLLLEGLAAIAERLGVHLPASTAQYFSELKVVEPESYTIALGFVVPIRGQLLKVLGNDGWLLDPDEARLELGDILARSRARSDQ